MDDSGRPELIDESRWNRVLAEYRKRVAAGERLSDEQFVAEHPDMADALRSWFATSSRPNAAGHQSPPSSDEVYSTTYSPLANRETIPPGEKPRSISPANGALQGAFGRYNIVRCIGQGAMGSVYLAEDTQLDREVALKIPKFAADDGPEMIQRFYREARAAATLRHANVCPVYDVGEIDGTHYLSMAYIEGRPLADLIKTEGPLPEGRAVEIVLKLAKAIAAAHAEGIIHRDLKPANIMIDEHGEPIIMDFGLARRINRDDARLTQAGLVVGSPAYMSPEQVEGNLETMGVGCDIYSLGVIFYELLAGEIPFKGSIAAVMGQIITTEPKKPSAVRAGVHPRLEAICLKMMAKKIADRHASMNEVVTALEHSRTGSMPVHQPHESVRSAKPLPEIGTASDALSSHDASQRFILRPWMVWTAVITVLAGFGVISSILVIVLRNQNEAGEMGPALSQTAQQEVRKRELELFLNGRRIEQEKFNEPLDLSEGDYVLEIRGGREPIEPRKYSVPRGKLLRINIEFDGQHFVFNTETKDAPPTAEKPKVESGTPTAEEPVPSDTAKSP